jgi:hypothetical protein
MTSPPQIVMILILTTPIVSACMVNSPIDTTINTETTIHKEAHLTGNNFHGPDGEPSPGDVGSSGSSRYVAKYESNRYIDIETTAMSLAITATVLVVLVLGCIGAWAYNRYTASHPAVSTPPQNRS